MNSAVCEVSQADAGFDDTDKAAADAPRVSVLAAARSRYCDLPARSSGAVGTEAGYRGLGGLGVRWNLRYPRS